MPDPIVFRAPYTEAKAAELLDISIDTLRRLRLQAGDAAFAVELDGEGQVEVAVVGLLRFGAGAGGHREQRGGQAGNEDLFHRGAPFGVLMHTDVTSA